MDEKEREIMFTLEEMVEIHDPSKSVKVNGMVDCVRTTKGYVKIDSSEDIKYLHIYESFVENDEKKLIDTDVMKDKHSMSKLIIKILNKIKT